MEDAGFHGKTTADIKAMREEKQKEIEATCMYDGNMLKLFLKPFAVTPTGPVPLSCMQVAIEDIENAQSTVKSWKSRPAHSFCIQYVFLFALQSTSVDCLASLLLLRRKEKAGEGKEGCNAEIEGEGKGKEQSKEQRGGGGG